MIPIIGGKLDGTQAAGKLVQIDEKDESYLLIHFVDEKKVNHWFYMLCDGPTVAEAMKIYKERAKL